MVLKISSKFELRRFCRTTGAVAMVCFLRFTVREYFFHHTFFLIYFVSLQQLKLSQPNPDDLGYVDSISVEEIGGARVC
jgi:T-complex protein 1 subunit theta